jgi:hypothetical protein
MGRRPHPHRANRSSSLGERTVAPDPRSHVAAPSGEEAAGRTGCDGDDGVLVALKHHLGDAGVGIPELHPAILGAAHDPLAVGGEADT